MKPKIGVILILSWLFGIVPVQAWDQLPPEMKPPERPSEIKRLSPSEIKRLSEIRDQLPLEMRPPERPSEIKRPTEPREKVTEPTHRTRRRSLERK